MIRRECAYASASVAATTCGSSASRCSSVVVFAIASPSVPPETSRIV